MRLIIVQRAIPHFYDDRHAATAAVGFHEHTKSAGRLAESKSMGLGRDMQWTAVL
jgi:hypothetical protein